MIEELHDIFPNLSTYKIWKILLTIKQRYKKYNIIGISRLEAIRFGISERQLQAFINFLRDSLAIEKVKMNVAKNGFKCNVYKISKWFAEGLEEVKEFVKKTLPTPIEFMKRYTNFKLKYGIYKFDYKGVKYIINTRGKYKGLLLDTSQNKIISIYKLLTA